MALKNVIAFVMILFCSLSFAEIKVGLVLDKGGKDDKSFNTAAFNGLTQAKNELKIFTKYVEATDDNAFEPLLKAFAQKDFDLIIAIGFSQGEPVKKVAKQFPNKHFVIVDAQVDLPNVKSLMFEEQEGSFLMGALAALSSKTGKIGFVGGMDVPLIRRFEMGYTAGAKHVNPKINITSNFVGVTSEAWNNPPKAKELSIAQYGSGVDIIYGAAGASNAGIFDGAEEKKKLAIGVDSNQNGLKPGFILTSMLKRVDVAVFEACKEAAAGKFAGGITRFGLANRGIDYAMDQYNEKLISKEILKKVEDIKTQVIAKKISVPDYYKTKAVK